MGYFELLLDSERRQVSPLSTRESAIFGWSSQTIKSISLKYFGTADVFASARAIDYVLIWLENSPADAAVIQSVTQGVTANMSATFVVPYETAAANVIFNETAGFEQKYPAKTAAGPASGMSQLTVKVSHNGGMTGITLGPWVMVLGIEMEN